MTLFPAKETYYIPVSTLHFLQAIKKCLSYPHTGWITCKEAYFYKYHLNYFIQDGALWHHIPPHIWCWSSPRIFARNGVDWLEIHLWSPNGSPDCGTIDVRKENLHNLKLTLRSLHLQSDKKEIYFWRDV